TGSRPLWPRGRSVSSESGGAAMRASSARSRHRRGARRLWPVVTLVVVGVAVVVATSRRRRLDRVASRDAGPELDTTRGPGSVAAPEDAPPVWLAGPAGNLYVRDGPADGSGAGGVPVLFVHALAGNGGQWALQLDHLRGRRRAVALDLRGH